MLEQRVAAMLASETILKSTSKWDKRASVDDQIPCVLKVKMLVAAESRNIVATAFPLKPADRIAVSYRRQTGPDGYIREIRASAIAATTFRISQAMTAAPAFAPVRAAGIRPAEVSRAIPADIRMIKYLADDQCERYEPSR